MQNYKMHIGGEWVSATSGETFDSYNPFTGKAWAKIPSGSAADAARAVDAAHTAFTTGHWLRLLRRPEAISSAG